MERVTCRLLPFEKRDGPFNMAYDEVMLQSVAGTSQNDFVGSQFVARNRPCLRFYGWTTATLSLGYFQRAADRLADPLLAGLPFVRRPTGGDAIVHHHEVTYCLAVPSTRHWATDGPWLHMHTVIASALGEFGVKAVPYQPWESGTFSGFRCFHHCAKGDLLVNAAKVVGSAQRKQRGAHMQHGSILLKRSPFTPSLPGIEELTGITIAPADLSRAIVRRLEEKLNWRVTDGIWRPEENREVTFRLLPERYMNAAWNLRR